VESTTAGKSKNIIKIAAALVIFVFLLLLWVFKGLQQTPLRSFVRSDLPTLDLDLQFVDISEGEIPANETKLAVQTAGSATTPPIATNSCPEIRGGDIRGSLDIKAGDKIPATCPRTAKWYVKRHPIGLSLYLSKPEKILPLFEQNGPFKEIWDSRFVQGVLHDPLRNSSIRAEDIGLQGLEGAFLARLFKETIAAHSQLHYDIVHGRKGFVYSFIRNECPYAAKVLPVITRVLVRSGYRIQKLKEPIFEMRIGLQRLFITEYETRVYLSNGLEALVNVMENLQPSGNDPSNSPIVLTVRAEAFIDKLPEVMTGEPTFSMDFSFGISQESSDFLRLPAGKMARHLRPEVFKGVLAGIPHDVFAAAITSFYLPLNMTPQGWRDLATEGPDDKPVDGPNEGGLAVIWDLSSAAKELTNMGVVIATQSDPDEALRLKNYFAKPELTAQCAGGTVFLAATSQLLLTRMKEACEHQSLSILDWERGVRSEEFNSKQLLFFMDPGVGIRELFLAGGAKSVGEEKPNTQWKEQYEKAKAEMRENSEKVFASLPIFTYSGNVAPMATTIQLQGKKVRQGAAQ
jgi:hypothetical protein